MKTPQQITEEAAAAIVTEHDIEDPDEPSSAIATLSWALGDVDLGGLPYESTLVALVEKAIAIHAAQHEANTLAHDDRDLEVGVWPAHPDMAADGGPEAIVVQIDTGDETKRLRVNINDAAVWDGDPSTDHRPGAWFFTDQHPED